MEIEATFPAVASSLAELRARVRCFAAACDVSDKITEDMALAVSEAATNAIEHGYRYGPGTLRLQARSRGDDELELIVADSGDGFAPRPDSPGLGLGLPIIARLASRLDIVAGEQGTEIHMVFRRGGSS